MISYKAHKKNVLELGCCVTRNPECVPHHIIGREATRIYGIKGLGLRHNHFLIIPLSPMMHTAGPMAIHKIGVEEWENRFGKQTDYLRWVNSRLPYNIYDLLLEKELNRY